MSANFEELGRRATPIGEVTLRRRLEPSLKIDVYEVKLGDEFLMSSLFTVAEIALATLGLAELPGTDLDVVVAGLGLGYTAGAVLEDPRVRDVTVVEALGAVIEWHEDRLLPFASALVDDERCQFVEADFFAAIAENSPFGVDAPAMYDAILVDIDHSPRHLLHPQHAPFYTPEGMQRLASRITRGGVFGLWSDDHPDDEFIAMVSKVFSTCEAHSVWFPNFYTGEDSASTVYIARR